MFAAVGAIVLALTGAEALYADMGHFGRAPIRLAWIGLVLPSLALNYMGQGALLMARPVGASRTRSTACSRRRWLVPAVRAGHAGGDHRVAGGDLGRLLDDAAGDPARLPAAHGACATPRRSEAGQIYMPAVNWVLLAGVIGGVLGFGSSSALAGAYGIAVTLTMLITTLLTYFVVRHGWRLPAAGGGRRHGCSSCALDALLVAGCAVKFFDGGWFPLVARRCCCSW